MAYVGSVNNAITHGGASDQLFALKTALLAAGWTVAQSGVTGGGVASSDLLTTVALFNTTSAWVRMQEPAGSPVKREYILQMGTAGTANGLIKYSRQTGFISGTPTATLAPQAPGLHQPGGGGLRCLGQRGFVPRLAAALPAPARLDGQQRPRPAHA